PYATRRSSDLCEVTSLVSKQPPISMLTSITTEPFFMLATIDSVTKMGDLFLPLTAAITTSQRFKALLKFFGCKVDVNKVLPKFTCIRLNLVMELSKTLTLAPSPIALLAANSPTVPAPRITTSIGGTPHTLPNMSPFPSLTLLNSSEAISTEAVPAISLNERTAGKAPVSSLINSNAKAVIRFAAKVSKYFFVWVVNWTAEI